MGYFAHHGLIVHIAGYTLDEEGSFSDKDYGVTFESIEAFRQSIPENMRQLLVGPVKTAINDDYVLMFGPDGSKEGWSTSDQGDEIRRKLTEMFSWTYDDGGSPFDVVEVRFGGDEPGRVNAVDPREVGEQ